LLNKANNNTFRRCNFITDSASVTVSDEVCFTATSSNTAVSTSGVNYGYLTIDSCTFSGGFYALDLTGPTVGSGNISLFSSITSNTVRSFKSIGVNISSATSNLT